jgi:hypothetical protein
VLPWLLLGLLQALVLLLQALVLLVQALVLLVQELVLLVQGPLWGWEQGEGQGWGQEQEQRLELGLLLRWAAALLLLQPAVLPGPWLPLSVHAGWGRAARWAASPWCSLMCR